MQTFTPPPDVPNPRVLAPKFLAEHPELRFYAELGVLHGDTVRRVAEAMAPQGTIILFDFEDMLAKVKEKLRDDKALWEKHDYLFQGCSRKLKDSYNWNLLTLLHDADIHGVHDRELFDYVFIDGAHTFDVDGFAVLLVTQMLAPGGYLEFDDYHWTIARSPTLNPKVFPSMAEWYTEEQIAVPHVKMIVDLLVERGGHYETVEKGRLYRKR